VLYSSPEYFVFFVVVWLAYRAAGTRQRSRLAILTVASLFFYAWAGIFDFFVFAFVVLVSWAAVALAHRSREMMSRRMFLAGGVVLMAMHLIFWKYTPWLCSLVQAADPDFLDGVPVHLPLPIGISFFTLQGIAYLVDYGRGDASYMKLREYLLFKSFFPQLIAGPIVRMKQLGPQLLHLPRVDAETFRAGLALFALGFFKKVAIADRMAVIADPLFTNPGHYGADSVALALLAYTAQIWGDFSGYTDMGRGSAKMLGIHLPENFYSPYLSRSPSEFWRRWHVTLSTWIRDYIYIPLGGSSGGLLRTAFVVVVTMSISGLWHGAALTFIIWGLYHGVLLVAERLLKRAGLPLFESVLALPLMFVLTVIGWMVFRAESIEGLAMMLKTLAGFGQAASAQVPWPAVVVGLGTCMLLQVFGYTALDGKGERQGASLAQRSAAYWNAHVLRDPSVRAGLSGAGVAVVIVAALVLRAGDTSARFIYFQF
jgi:alginate O-acetyltransferase complex protein AlgI